MDQTCDLSQVEVHMWKYFRFHGAAEEQSDEEKQPPPIDPDGFNYAIKVLL